jgi:hypothetical protein
MLGAVLSFDELGHHMVHVAVHRCRNDGLFGCIHRPCRRILSNRIGRRQAGPVVEQLGACREFRRKGGVDALSPLSGFCDLGLSCARARLSVQ